MQNIFQGDSDQEEKFNLKTLGYFAGRMKNKKGRKV